MLLKRLQRGHVDGEGEQGKGRAVDRETRSSDSRNNVTASVGATSLPLSLPLSLGAAMSERSLSLSLSVAANKPFFGVGVGIGDSENEIENKSESESASRGPSLDGVSTGHRSKGARRAVAMTVGRRKQRKSKAVLNRFWRVPDELVRFLVNLPR